MEIRQPTQRHQPNAQPHDPHDVEKNKDLAAFSYIYMMSIVVYFLKGKESAFIRYHSKQAMILFVLSIIAWMIPLLGHLLELLVLLGMVVGFIAAAQGQWKDVPIVGSFSRGELDLRESWKQIVATTQDLIHRFTKSASATQQESHTHHAEQKTAQEQPLATTETPSMLPNDGNQK